MGRWKRNIILGWPKFLGILLVNNVINQGVRLVSSESKCTRTTSVYKTTAHGVSQSSRIDPYYKITYEESCQGLSDSEVASQRATNEMLDCEVSPFSRDSRRYLLLKKLSKKNSWKSSYSNTGVVGSSSWNHQKIFRHSSESRTNTEVAEGANSFSFQKIGLLYQPSHLIWWLRRSAGTIAAIDMSKCVGRRDLGGETS